MATAAVIPITAGLPKGSLYEITDHLAALLDSLEMCEPENRAACEAEIRAYIEAEVRKVDGLASYLAHCEAQAKFAAEEVKRLQERMATFEARFERTRSYIIETMEAAGVKKLDGRTATFSLRACPSSVDILDESAIPEEFKITKTVVSVDKRAVKTALESGRDVPGADLLFGRSTLVRK